MPENGKYCFFENILFVFHMTRPQVKCFNISDYYRALLRMWKQQYLQIPGGNCTVKVKEEV